MQVKVYYTVCTECEVEIDDAYNLYNADEEAIEREFTCIDDLYESLKQDIADQLHIPSDSIDGIFTMNDECIYEN